MVMGRDAHEASRFPDNALPTPTMSTRKWYVDQALSSTRSQADVLKDMTMEEIETALSLESSTRRRKHIVRRLVGRAVHLNEQSFVASLKKRFNLP